MHDKAQVAQVVSNTSLHSWLIILTAKIIRCCMRNIVCSMNKQSVHWISILILSEGFSCVYLYADCISGLLGTFECLLSICFSPRLHEKFDLHQIYSVQIWCKKVQTRVEEKAKMVNTAFALKFTTPCKLSSKCGLYHLSFFFTPSLLFFAPYLHRVNLCKSNFSCAHCARGPDERREGIQTFLSSRKGRQHTNITGKR